VDRLDGHRGQDDRGSHAPDHPEQPSPDERDIDDDFGARDDPEWIADNDTRGGL
jgi:hypothetical protein